MSVFTDPTRAFIPSVNIAAYKKIGGGTADLVSSVLVPYDMPSLTTHYTNDIRSAKTAGGDGAVNQFNFSEPSEMKLRLLLDDTTYANAVAYLMPSNTIPDGVDAIVEKLLTMCHAIDGKTHQPYFIRVTPMQMPLVKGPHSGFGGFLSSMEIRNEIVDSLGCRVKATVDLSFTECKTAKESEKEIGRSSPDLTHELQTFGGDKLVNHVNQIYGSPEYVHSVAEFNQLNSIRALKPGKTVKYPPLES
ncbi:CIS tube protein [Vibrio quintilis]|uniref:Contractile injection system tube protein N-terminal domain-containing protein n=1 Tax=Vibrio quintilis TaxID=1117707 RepID=A0A1M7YV07_9VIBR|nr:hypothetical protein [Vibrio quintilis]SHO56464.1 hypothetical protein VQ7734_02233 [Vibrio quintilis]